MTTQFSSFTIDGRLYGIDVKYVQEITLPMRTTQVPLAPRYVHGLVNLRGQLTTAIGLRELFELPKREDGQGTISIVCKAEGLLLSLVVDEIGDVLEVEQSQFESTPDIISGPVGHFMGGVYKLPNELLSVLDTKK